MVRCWTSCLPCYLPIPYDFPVWRRHPERFKSSGHLGDGLHFLVGPSEDVEARTCRSPNGGTLISFLSFLATPIFECEFVCLPFGSSRIFDIPVESTKHHHIQVMGLMLGEFVDDYTVNVIDVFAMPQSGTVSSI